MGRMTTSEPASWQTTTHDWAVAVDREHLDAIRRAPATYAPGGVLHLVLEVMAYADEEAADLGRRGTCVVTLHADGSVSVADDGRGTDTRQLSAGEAVRKPIMATRDVRFFDTDHDVLLPDGHPRRGISVVAALSTWLTHTNRRTNGAWTQRYEHGVPTSDLVPIEPTQDTGTTVRFLADPHVAGDASAADRIRSAADFEFLEAEVRAEASGAP